MVTHSELSLFVVVVVCRWWRGYPVAVSARLILWHCSPPCMHFYMHVTPLHRGFEPTMPFHTAYPHVLLCGLAWHLGAVVRLSRDNLSYFSVHCTPFYIADFQSARCYKGQPFRPAQLPHGEPAWHKLVVIHAFNMHNSISLFVQQMALICVSELIST